MLYPPLQDASSQKNTALALEALYADISPQPYHLPLIAAAGVLLLEADYVAQLYFQNHGFFLRKKIGEVVVNLVS